MSDERLFELYGQENISAFDEIYKRYSWRIFNFALKRLRDPSQSEEVLQIVLLKLHQLRANYDPKFKAAQWVFIIARSELKDYRQKEQRSQAVTREMNNNGDFLSQVSLLHPITIDERDATAMLRSLSVEERSVVTMKVVDEMSYREISEVVGKTEENLRKTVSRALQRLRRKKR